MTDHLAQVRRDREAYLSRHDRFFVVRQRFFIGPPIRQWAEDHTVIETGNITEVIRALPHIDGPEAVIAINVRNGTSDDVSKGVALLVAGHIRDGEFNLTDDLRNFIEEHWPVGSVIPAAI